MRKFLILIFAMFIAFNSGGCKAGNTTSQRDKIVINMPSDDSVNGYRLEDDKHYEQNDDIISADSVTLETNTNVSGNGSSEKIMYCANIKSKVFHKKDCGSVKKIKEENKFFLSDRQQLINDGYKPCGNCEP